MPAEGAIAGPIDERGDDAARRGRAGALLALLAIVAGYFALHLGRGDVLFPHDNRPEVGAGSADTSIDDLWRRDVTTLYIPEFAAQLGGDHAGWLATWTPHNGLGRPVHHFGASPTFLVSRAVGGVTRDPFAHHSLMTALAVLGTALFAFLLLGAVGVGAAGSFVGALALSIGPLYPTWDMVPLVQWGYCGAVAALFAAESWRVSGSAWWLVALTFALHATLLTGFPQHLIALAHVCVGWVLLRALRDPSRSRRARRVAVAGVALAAALALASTAPVHLDVLDEWARSTRADAPQSFRTSNYAGALWPALFAAVSAASPGQIGLSFGPLVFGLAAAGAASALLRARRCALPRAEVALLVGAAALFVAATESSALSEALAFAGLAVSDWPPVFGAHLPVAVLAALGVDALVRGERAAAFAGGAALAVGAAGLALEPPGHVSVSLAAAAALGAAALLAAPLLRSARARGALLASATVAGSLTIAWNVVVWRPRASIETDSPLAAVLRERCADGSRTLRVGTQPPGRTWLPPNVDALLGTRSLSTYSHLESRAFHRWIEPLRPPARRAPYLRAFLVAEGPEALDRDFLAASGVRTLLSTAPLDALGARVEAPGDLRVWSVDDPGPLAALLDEDATAPTPEGLRVEPDALRSGVEVTAVDRSLDDRLVLEFEASDRARVLFLSQAHHPRWRARADGIHLDTVPINGLFQGVRVPAGATGVTLRFLPRARWMWVPQWAFVGLGLAWATASLRRRRRSARP